jgi:hypothetical protein
MTDLEHYVQTFTDGTRYRAECPCGWESEWYGYQEEAEWAGEDHSEVVAVLVPECQYESQCHHPGVAEVVLLRVGDPVTDDSFRRSVVGPLVCERHLARWNALPHIQGATGGSNYVQVVRAVEWGQ